MKATARARWGLVDAGHDTIPMKKLQRIHSSSEVHWVGDGFPVRSVFNPAGLGRELSPFLLLDYAAPHRFPPGTAQRGVGAHPHKGFETVTVVYQGELAHRDSSGGGGVIGPGEVQWMTAGRGIVHEEFHSPGFTARGGVLQMVQLWVNLRAADKGAAPGYQTLRQPEIPEVPLAEDAGRARVIAGDFAGVRGPARTFSPVELWDVTLRAGARTVLPVPDGHTAAVLVIAGAMEATDEAGQAARAGEGDLAVYRRAGAGVEVRAGGTETTLLLLAGEPIVEPVVAHGPFVMNSRAEILQAMEEYQTGRMGRLPEA